MAAHSQWGASGMYRWAACPGSINATKGIESKSSQFASEGTLAHMIAEYCLLKGADPLERLGEKVTVDGFEHVVDEEMCDAVQLYLDTVHADLCEDDELAVEQKFNLNSFTKGLYGINDASIYKPDGTLKIYDLKYGKGVAVEAKGNPQLLYYALGAATLNEKRLLSQIEVVIVQPRCPHPDGPVRRWSVDPFDLLEWSDVLIEAVKATKKKNAPLVPGEKQCRFCPAVPTCKAVHDLALETAQADFSPDGPPLLPEPESLGDNSLATILEHADLIGAWVTAVKAHAQAKAESGVTVPGWKLVQKRATRRWIDADAAIAHLTPLVPAEKLFKPAELRTPVQVEKILGKAGKAELFDLVNAESSGLSLVRESDRRESAKSAAEDDFAAIPRET